MINKSVFGCLRKGKRVWAVAAVRGDANRLSQLHDKLYTEMKTDDRLVYLGNILGDAWNGENAVDEALNFRRWVVGRSDGSTDDVIFLRGAQEEMLQKLFELQFAHNPTDVLIWMLKNGVGGTIRAYGGNPEEGLAAIRQSAVATTRWTSDLRERFQKTGHQPWLSNLKHAAFDHQKAILFVSRGIDHERPLDSQHDTFWWDGSNKFDEITHPISNFIKVVRGEDLAMRGLVKTEFTVSLDGGCGANGKLIAACFSVDGELVKFIEI